MARLWHESYWLSEISNLIKFIRSLSDSEHWFLQATYCLLGIFVFLTGLLIGQSAVSEVQELDELELDKLINRVNLEHRDVLFIWIDEINENLKFEIYNENINPIFSGEIHSSRPNILIHNTVEYDLNKFSQKGELVEEILIRNPEIGKNNNENWKVIRALDFLVAPAQSHPAAFAWKPVAIFALITAEIVLYVYLSRKIGTQEGSICAPYEKELQKCLGYYQRFHSTPLHRRIDIYEYLAEKKNKYDHHGTKCIKTRREFGNCYFSYRAALRNSPFGMSRMQEFRVRPPAIQQNQ